MIEQPTVGAQGATLGFPILQQLVSDANQDIIIEGIEFFTSSECTLSPTGANVVSMADLLKCYLTLYVISDVDQAISIKRIPLSRLRVVHTNGTGAATFFAFDTLNLKNLVVMWDKSYIEKADGFAGVNNFLMGVIYKRLRPGDFQKFIKAGALPGW